MNTQPNQKDVAAMQATLEQLWKVPVHRVSSFIINPLYDQHTFQGIYAVSDPDDKQIVYIGKTNNGTKEKGLVDRICGHAANHSQLQIALGVDRKTFKQYQIRAIKVDDPIHRGLTEFYGIAIFHPKANRVARMQALPDYDDSENVA